MKKITFSYIDAADLPEDLLNALHDLSPMRNEDGGFSFVVPVSYLRSYLEDLEQDRTPPDATATKHYTDLSNLLAQVLADGYDALFVCNDAELQVQD